MTVEDGRERSREAEVDGAAHALAEQQLVITIVPEESGDSTIENRPAIFEIDEPRCIACGLCVEACPCDAIRMDTGLHAQPVEDRAAAIETKESMLARGIRSTAVQGGEGPGWRAGGPAGPDLDANHYEVLGTKIRVIRNRQS